MQLLKMKYNGTQTIKNIPDKLRTFFESSKFCDCTFNLADTELKAHKLVLTCFSPVFEKMFYGPLACSEVTIKDIDPDIFQQMLRFMYYDQIVIESVAHAWTVYSAANKYFIKELMDACIDYIERNLSLDNLALSYEHAEFYSLQGLKQICLDDLICFLSGVLLLSDYHMKASTLVAVLKEYPPIHSQPIAKGVIKWAQHECENAHVSVTADNIVDILKRHKLCQFLNNLTTNDAFDNVILKAMKNDCNAIYKGVVPAKKRKVRRLKICKLAERIDLDRDCEASIEIMSNKRLAIFALLLNTAMAPPTVVVDQQEKSYAGSIRVRVLDSLEQEMPFQRTLVERTFPYGSETLVDLDEVVVIEANCFYDFRISYSVSNQCRCSVSRHYADKLQEYGGKIEIYEIFGTVLQGISFYPV